MTPEAIEIRAAAEALVSTLSIGSEPAFKHVGKVPVEQEPDDQLPSLLVLATRERGTPDGDLNTGQVAFVNELTLAFLIALSGNDRDKADNRLSNRINLVLQTVFRDIGFVGMIEGFSGFDIARSFDKDGERFFARAKIEVTVQFRSQWPPVITDDLEQIVFTTRPYGADEDTPAITTVVDLPTA